MKKIGKVLSLVMALALVVCSLSATAFAEVKDYTQMKIDGFYRFNITDGVTRQDAVDVGVSIYEKDNSESEIHIYYEKNEEGSYKRVTVNDGIADATDKEPDNIFDMFWDQANNKDEEVLLDYFVVGTITKINPISGYHFEKITDVSQLSGIATDTTDEDLEQILAAAYDIANPIFTAVEYDDDCIAFVYGVEERDTEFGIKNIYTTISTENTEEEEKMDAAGIQGILADTEYVYMLVKDPVQPTPEAKTVTSPQTSDSNLTTTFIALGVVAVCGLAVVTFSTKKER